MGLDFAFAPHHEEALAADGERFGGRIQRVAGPDACVAEDEVRILRGERSRMRGDEDCDEDQGEPAAGESNVHARMICASR